MAYTNPETAADAHRLKMYAKTQRTSAKEWEAMGNSNNAALRLWEAECAEEAANKFLALSEAPAVGTGGELIPTRNDSESLVGIVDTVRNPDMATISASRNRLDLANDAGASELALDMAETIKAKDSVEKAVAHQMAAAHSLAMNLVAEANRHELPADRVKLANAAARMMTVFQEGALTISKLRGGGKQQVTVVHQHVQVAGGQVAVAGTMDRKTGDEQR